VKAIGKQGSEDGGGIFVRNLRLAFKGLHPVIDGMNWIDLVQDRDQCRALVNTMMNIRVS
jgi:hypothetical protein